MSSTAWVRLSESAAIEIRPTSSAPRNWPSPRLRIADQVLVLHPDVVEEQLAGVEPAPADAAHLRTHREARRALLDDEAAEPSAAIVGGSRSGPAT